MTTRTVVITGVSRGLGEALFSQVYARGDRVVGLGRTFTGAQRELARSEPDRVVLYEIDLARPDARVDRAVLAPLLDVPRTALIHNAATVVPVGAIGTLSPDRMEASVRLNFTAPVLLTNEFLAARPPGSSATVLFISSGAAHRVIGGWAVYSAGKRGGEAFFDALAAQYAGDPLVTVANVNPGVMDTAMQAALREATGYFPDRQRFLDLHRHGELPDPGQVAGGIIAAYLD